MLEQRSSNKASVWIARLHRGWIWGMAFLIVTSVFVSCTASPPQGQTSSPTPQETVGTSPFRGAVQTFDGDFTLTLDITPNRSGPNVFTLSVRDNHTMKPVTDVVVTLYTTMQDMVMGTDSVTLHATGKGLFSATSNNLAMRGHWAIGITIATPDHIIHKAGVSVITL